MKHSPEQHRETAARLRRMASLAPSMTEQSRLEVLAERAEEFARLAEKAQKPRE